MANKDKFKKLQQQGGGSFQDMVQQATTVAAIEKQAEQTMPQPTSVTDNKVGDSPSPSQNEPTVAPVRYARLPNPQMPVSEINLVEQYCRQFDNMTKQDFVELAIIEKLHSDGDMTQEDFNKRYDEIRNRPARGHRKGTKTQICK